MKKLIIAIFFLSLGINAQDIKGGFKISPNFSTFSKDIDNSSKGNIGYGIGYFETCEINSNLALQGEINYTNVSYETNKGTTKIQYSFIEIPLILKYKLDNLNIGFGVQYGFGMTGQTKTQEQTTASEPENDKGILLDVSLDRDKYIFGLRYYNGAEKIYNGNSIGNISFTIGYIIF